MASTSKNDNNSSSSQPLEKLYECEFEIRAKVPQELLAKFTEKQANMLGIRGWIEVVGDGVYKGHLEGEQATVQTIRQLIETAEKFVDKIEAAVFSELKEIEKYTQENFQRR